MRLTSKSLGPIVVVILFGGILFTTLMGWWQTESVKEPVKYTTGELAGEYNPADIRGSYTFGDINRLFNIPLEDLRVAFGLPSDADVAAFQAKSLEEMYSGLEQEIGTGSLRLFVALYNHLPYNLVEDALPAPAVDLLIARGGLTEEQLVYLESHTVSLDAAAVQEVAATPAAIATPETPAAATEEHVPEAGLVAGKTTFQDLLDWGVSQEKIEEIIGGPLPVARGMLVKDYCTQNGLSFSTIKTALQAAVDAAQP